MYCPLHSAERAKKDLIKRKFRCLCLTILLLSTLRICTPARAEVSESARGLAEQEFQQLLISAPPPRDMPWPPNVEIVTKRQTKAFTKMKKQDRSENRVGVCDHRHIN